MRIPARITERISTFVARKRTPRGLEPLPYWNPISLFQVLKQLKRKITTRTCAKNGCELPCPLRIYFFPHYLGAWNRLEGHCHPLSYFCFLACSIHSSLCFLLASSRFAHAVIWMRSILCLAGNRSCLRLYGLSCH